MNPECAEAVAALARAAADNAVRDAEYRERVVHEARRIIEARRTSSHSFATTTDV